MSSTGLGARPPLSSFSPSCSCSSSPRRAGAVLLRTALQGRRGSAGAFAMPPPALSRPAGVLSLESFRSLIAVCRRGPVGERILSQGVARQPAPFRTYFALASLANFSSTPWDGTRGRTVSSITPSAQGAYDQYQQDKAAGLPRPTTIPWQRDFANFVQLIGTVGRYIDIKYLDSGKVVAKTSLAVKTGSLRGDDTSWFELELWDELAEVASQHVQRGERICVTGKILVEKWVKDDVRHSVSKVVVRDFCFVEPYNKSQGQDESVHSPSLSNRIPEASNVDATQRNWNQERPANPPTGTAQAKNYDAVALATEKKWQEFFADPTQWWDNRHNKKNPKSPDFKHKSTQEALWLESWSNPAWVSEQMAVLEKQAPHGGNYADSRQQAQSKKLSSFRDSDFMY